MKFSFLLLLTVFPFSFSCSLNYLQGQNSEDSIPEFCFINANYTKYESSRRNVTLKAGQLEQYKSDNAVFAKNASFETFDEDENTETSGSCQLIAAATKKEIYTLYGDIILSLPKQDMEIEADTLNFNKKTEQITSGKSSEVHLTKKDVTMQGYGFSASGVSKSFSFVDTVSGIIDTDDSSASNAVIHEESELQPTAAEVQDE